MEISAFNGTPMITNGQVNEALSAAVAQVRRNLPFFTYCCQSHSSMNQFYPPCDNVQWTCGFWPGEIWLSYESTGDEAFKASGDILVQSFLDRIRRRVGVDHHDMGFLYTPSCVAAYKLTGNASARTAALLAAEQLMSRFQRAGQFHPGLGDARAARTITATSSTACSISPCCTGPGRRRGMRATAISPAGTVPPV